MKILYPFLNYNLPKDWCLTSSPIITADWKTPDHKGKTVPVGAGIGRVSVVGMEPINASLSVNYIAQNSRLFGKFLWETGHYEHKFSSCFLLLVDTWSSRGFALAFRRTDFDRL